MTKRKLSEPDAEPPRRSTRLRTTTQASSAGADQSRDNDPAKEAFRSKPKAATAGPKKAAKKRSKGDDSVSPPPKSKSKKDLTT